MTIRPARVQCTSIVLLTANSLARRSDCSKKEIFNVVGDAGEIGNVVMAIQLQLIISLIRKEKAMKLRRSRIVMCCTRCAN